MSLASLGLLVNAELFVARSVAGELVSESLMFLGSINLPLILMILLMRLMAVAEVGPFIQVGVLLAAYAPVLGFYESRFSMLRMVKQNV